MSPNPVDFEPDTDRTPGQVSNPRCQDSRNVTTISTISRILILFNYHRFLLEHVCGQLIFSVTSVFSGLFTLFYKHVDLYRVWFMTCDVFIIVYASQMSLYIYFSAVIT